MHLRRPWRKMEYVFGLFGPEVVQFVESRDSQLMFVTRTAQRIGSSLKVRFLLSGAQTKKIDVLVRIAASRPLATLKGHLCMASVQLADNHRTALEHLLQKHAPRLDLGGAARRSERLPVSLKVLARELPTYSCLTVDLSLHGVKLACLSPVMQGQLLNLVIKSDMDGLPDLAVRGRVVWCRQKTGGKGYLAGVEFATQAAADLGDLQRFHRALGYRLQGDIQQRQLA